MERATALTGRNKAFPLAPEEFPLDAAQRLTSRGPRLSSPVIWYAQSARRERAMICKHTDQIRLTSTDKHVCEDCVKLGDKWVHLRLCLECGHVGCCDSSKNKHATRHFSSSRHPLIRSIEPGESWIWCYVDEMSPGSIDG